MKLNVKRYYAVSIVLHDASFSELKKLAISIGVKNRYKSKQEYINKILDTPIKSITMEFNN